MGWEETTIKAYGEVGGECEGERKLGTRRITVKNDCLRSRETLNMNLPSMCGWYIRCRAAAAFRVPRIAWDVQSNGNGTH